ncbi:synaptotagmin-like protein 4 [Stylophora pistillata]|uniref:synaptotagmin-like protein 4 n=1 Tax=Stylophora pistillata TaxID=50429 RepID=UPI000C0545FD|nr:synaptotagmin-like protein 4 [Stylophora pistillata]
MDHFARLLPSFPKLFDNNKSETNSEVKPETDQNDSKTQTLPEQEPLVLSRENLAFEEDEKHLEPKDTSADSASSTLETTVELMESETGPDAKELEKEGDNSGISVGQVNGNDVISAEEETRHDENDQGPKMKPVLESISAFALQFMDANAPEIKVDKPQTLFSVATGDSSDTPPEKTPQSPRRHTEHNVTNKLLEKNSLLPEAALTKRRHSDFAVSAPRPVNDELASQDLKKHDSVGAGQSIVRKGSHPDVIRASRGPQWSPSLERKRLDEAKKGKKKDERRKTLAELALEAGYTPNIDTEMPVYQPGSLQVIKADPSKGSSESLLSEHGEEHYNSVPVTGELFVSLRYEMPSKRFEVHVLSANNLSSADAKRSSSDPYVKTYLLPDRRSKRKTKTKKDTLNPHFDEILEYFMGYDELLTRTLHLSVWHKMIGRNCFLGEIKIPMNHFVEAGNSLERPVAKWFNLTEKTDETDGLPSIPCELVLSLKYVTADKVKKKGRTKGELHVHLLEARNLPGMDANGMSDPYCKCLLLPDKKGKTKHKTPVIKRTLNPTFDHKFNYEELSPEDLKERVLEITIYDFDLASSDEFLGGVRLGLGTSSNKWDDSTEDESQIWNTMLSRSNVWIQVVVPLRSTMVSTKNM